MMVAIGKTVVLGSGSNKTPPRYIGSGYESRAEMLADKCPPTEADLKAFRLGPRARAMVVNGLCAARMGGGILRQAQPVTALPLGAGLIRDGCPPAPALDAAQLRESAAMAAGGTSSCAIGRTSAAERSPSCCTTSSRPWQKTLTSIPAVVSDCWLPVRLTRHRGAFRSAVQ